MFERLKNFLRKDYVNVDGSVLALPDKRWCGKQFRDNELYIKSAEKEAQRLIDHFECSQNTRVLDVGCGQGRLPIGILRVVGDLNYTGLDVHKPSIDWCKSHIENKHPSFRFEHINIYNERYAKEGVRIDKNFNFKIKSKSIDIVYLFSVFTHMIEEEMKLYLKEFSRILCDGGNVFFTGYVEEDVENFTINPENYQFKMQGPLHIVRYNKNYLFSIIEECGFSILEDTHGNEADGQSAIYLRKN